MTAATTAVTITRMPRSLLLSEYVASPKMNPAGGRATAIAKGK